MVLPLPPPPTNLKLKFIFEIEFERIDCQVRAESRHSCRTKQKQAKQFGSTSTAARPWRTVESRTAVNVESWRCETCICPIIITWTPPPPREKEKGTAWKMYNCSEKEHDKEDCPKPNLPPPPPPPPQKSTSSLFIKVSDFFFLLSQV